MDFKEPAAVAGGNTRRRTRLSVIVLVMSGSLIPPLVFGFYFMTRILGESEMAALGILGSALVVATGASVVGCHVALMTMYGDKGLIIQTPDEKRRAFRELGVRLAIMVPTISGAAFAMVLLKQGKTDLALAILGGVSLIMFPSTYLLKKKVRRMRAEVKSRTETSVRRTLLKMALTLVLHANISVAIILGGIFLWFDRQSTAIGSSLVLVGLSSILWLHFRAKEADRQLMDGFPTTI